MVLHSNYIVIVSLSYTPLTSYGEFFDVIVEPHSTSSSVCLWFAGLVANVVCACVFCVVRPQSQCLQTRLMSVHYR